LEVAKVNGKTPNFHSFLGISLEIGLFPLVFAVFCLEDAILAAIFLDEREQWHGRDRAIPADIGRFVEAERRCDFVRDGGCGTARTCG
jgi:hypothetical protein